MKTNNVYQFKTKPKHHNEVLDCKVLTKHKNLSNRLKESFDVLGYSDVIWDRYIPQAIANKTLDKDNINTWSQYCAGLLKPNDFNLLAASKLWDGLVQTAIDEGAFKKLHADVWREYCITRAHIDELRVKLDKQLTYQVITRINGNEALYVNIPVAYKIQF